VTRESLLSFQVGVPLALVAMALLFWWELRSLSTRRSSKLLTASTVGVCLALLVLIVGRFIEFA
jgi:uncharacterized membrane protein YidH (DUF202 family)